MENVFHFPQTTFVSWTELPEPGSSYKVKKEEKRSCVSYLAISNSTKVLSQFYISGKKANKIREYDKF